MPDKVYSCDILNDKALSAAVAQGCNTIVTNNIKLERSDLPEHIRMIDANQARLLGSWYSYRQNETLLLKLKDKFPKLFEYKGFDLTSALIKQIYWTNFRSGYLKVSLEREGFTSENIIDGDRPGLLRKLKDFSLVFALAIKSLLFNWNNIKSTKQQKPHQAAYVFHIESELLLLFWKDLIEQFPSEQTALFVQDKENKIPANLIEQYRKKGVTILSEFSFPPINPPTFNPFKLRAHEASMIRKIIMFRDMIVALIENISIWVNDDIQAIILNASENNYLGHIFNEVKKKYTFKVYNTMNGSKAATANNTDTEFDAWFVWDEMLKDLLEKDCKLPIGQVVNTGGHLMQDKIKSHSYGSSLPLTENQIKEMKIISFGSCRGRRKDKVDALASIYEWMRKNPDVLMLYRPHPVEKEEDFLLPNDELRERVFLIKYDADTVKDTLYDQLIITHLMIALGSTVLLEAKWAGIPAITFEQKETSFVYCVDDTHIFHCKTQDSLLERTEKILQNPREIDLNQQQKDHSEVAKKYAQYIINNVKSSS